MKKVQLTLLALLTSTNLMMAGGDMVPVTPYEVEDIKAAEVVPVTIPTEPKVVAPVPAADVSPIYVGIGIAATKYKTNCQCSGTKSGTDTTGGIVARVGYDFNKYMGIEARGLIAPSNSDGTEVKHAGVFVKPQYPVTDGLNVYGLGGIAKTTTKGPLQNMDVSGLAFGGGLEYDLSDDKKKDAKYDREFDGIADQEKGFGVFADYERLYYKSGSPDLDAVSVGVTYDF